MKNLLNMSDSEDEDKPKKSKRPKKGDAPAIAEESGEEEGTDAELEKKTKKNTDQFGNKRG